MADIKELARRADEIKRTGNALTVADAIGKAIRGKGITHPPDVKSLMSRVGTQYARDKRDEQRPAGKRGIR